MVYLPLLGETQIIEEQSKDPFCQDILKKIGLQLTKEYTKLSSGLLVLNTNKSPSIFVLKPFNNKSNFNASSFSKFRTSRKQADNGTD